MQFTLWGWTGRWAGVDSPVRVTGGTLRDCRVRQRQFEADYPDALAGIYARGEAPTGLRLQVAEHIAKEN